MHLAALLVLLFTHSSPPRAVQTWQKQLAPGVISVMQWDHSTPRLIYALRISVHSPDVRPLVVLGGKTVYEDNPSKGRATVSQIVKEESALAGINGDFFPFTGLALNITVHHGELLCPPYQLREMPNASRSAFGWGANYSVLSHSKLEARLNVNGQEMEIQGWNQEAVPEALTLNTPAAGLAIAKAPNSYAVLRVSDGKWTPDGTLHGTITSVGSNLTRLAVPEGSAVLVGRGAAIARLKNLGEGEEVSITVHTTGFDWSKVTEVVGGGPTLVKNGEVQVNWQAERMVDSFSNNRHPRSAIGRTKNGDLWLVAVDGRSEISAGATLQELATIMSKFGCVDAMNLDGGGSTAMNIMGLTMNRPSDGIERPVADGIVIEGPSAAPTSAALRISEGRITANSVILTIRALADPKRTIPNSEVFWAASGSAWIDQGGTLHSIGAGSTTVRAYVRGRRLTMKLRTRGKAMKAGPGFSAAD